MEFQKMEDFSHDYVNEDEANNAHMVQYIDEVLREKVSEGQNYPREVEIYFYLWRIHHIDTVAQSFSISVTVSLSWIEDDAHKNFKSETFEDGDESSWKLKDFKWNPQVKFNSVLEEDEIEHEDWFRVTPMVLSRKSINTKANITKDVWMKSYRDSNEQMRVTQFMRRKLTVSEAFELKNFPFDIQPLHIQFSSSWDCKNVLLTFNKTMPSSMDPNPLDSQEWEFHKPRLIAYDMDWRDDDQPLLSLSSQSVSGARYSRAYIALTVKRKPEYYLWNIYVMLLILGTLSFTVFSVDPQETGDRLGIMLTLVLALVAFKLVLVQMLPSISYLTMLDVYTLGSIQLMFFISIFNAILPALGLYGQVLITADFVVLVIGAIMWISINVWFILKTIYLTTSRNAEIKQINEKFEGYRRAASSQPIYKYHPLN